MSQIDWDGAGLPPKGAVCEISLSAMAKDRPIDGDRFLSHDGMRAEILLHHDIGGELAALYAVRVHAGFEYHSLIAGNFRPIRTPEQIAAEEREKAVEAMWTVLNLRLPESARIFSGPHSEALRVALGTLHKAGLRFPEGGDA